MNNIKVCALCLLGALSCAPVFAEEYAIQPLDKDLNPIVEERKEYNYSEFNLDDAIEIALEHNRTIKNSEYSVKSADAKVGQARAASSLKLSANANKTRLDKVKSQGIELDTSKYTNGEHLTLTQPLYIGGADKAGRISARLGRDIANSSRTLTKQNIVKGVSLGYYNWLYAREKENVGKQDLDLAQAHYDLVNKRYQAEQTSKYELLRADVRLADTKSSYLSKKNDALMAKLDLLKILGLPMDTEIDTNEKLEIIDIHPDVLDDLEKAINLREDLKIKRNQKRIANQGLETAKAGLRPSVAISATLGSDKPSQREPGTAFKRDESWNATLGLEFPLLDGRLTNAKIKEAKASIDSAENDYQESLENTELEVYKSALSLQTAIEMVASQKENMKQADETLRLAKVRYENGLFTQIDLFDAETAWSTSMLGYLGAVFQHHQARLSYMLAVGKLGRDIKGF